MSTENAYLQIPPKVAMINDIAGFGRCSSMVAIPVISVMGVQVCPIPTAILSNHLGFPSCYFDDYTTHMADYMDAWRKLSLSFEGLYCGFLGSEAQIALVEAFWELCFLSSSSFFLLDPVMGDHGRAYSSITPSHISHMKSLAARADFLTPNITEACLLTDTPFKESGWTSEELVFLCEKLAAHSLARQLHIVITGLHTPKGFSNFLWEDGHCDMVSSPSAGASRPGTGDIFASILTADAAKKRPFAHAVQKASDFIFQCIKASEEAGIPVQDGVIFEPYLHTLA